MLSETFALPAHDEIGSNSEDGSTEGENQQVEEAAIAEKQIPLKEEKNVEESKDQESGAADTEQEQLFNMNRSEG